MPIASANIANQIADFIASDMVRRCELLRAAKHTLLIEASPIVSKLPQDMPAEKVSIVQLSDHQASSQYGSELSVDSVVVPLFTNPEHLKRCLDIAQQSLKQGGWLLCNTLISGSFNQVTPCRQSGQLLPLLSVPEIIAQLAKIGRQQPIIDCNRFALHYTHIEQMLDDCQTILNCQAALYATDGAYDSDIQSVMNPVMIELAHIAVYFEKPARQSMTPCPIPITQAAKPDRSPS